LIIPGAVVHLSRPALAVTAALTLTAGAAPALAASTSTPSKGNAHSALTLLQVSLAGHTVTAGTIEGVASDATSRVAKLVVTPVTLDGTAIGQQTITPANSPMTVPSSAQSATVPNLLSLTGPTLAVSAKSGPTAVVTSAVLKALGAVTLKPAGLVTLPLNLQAASMTNIAQVTSAKSEAEKSLNIGSLSLPSVNDLLTGLGVDLDALLAQLTQGNLNALNGLVSGTALTTLNTAVDNAQAALATAPDSLAAAVAALAPATTQLNQATAALNTATSAFTSAMGTAFANPALATALGAVGITSTSSPATVVSLIGALDPTLQSAAQGAVDAQTVQTTAQTLVDNLNALIDALQNLVNAVLGAVTSNGDPLAALGNISVATRALATSSSATPTASATLGSVDVLGTAASVGQLTSVLGGVTNTLAGVLNSVAGVTFTPPSVQVGTPHTSASKHGTTHRATASVTGLTVTLPTIKLPAALSTITSSVPGASVVNGVVNVLGGSVKVGSLDEAADLTPGTTSSTPSTTPSSSSGGPSLAGTGMSTTIPAVAALLVIAALAVLRRRATRGDV
jgi:hypothetical protein